MFFIPSLICLLLYFIDVYTLDEKSPFNQYLPVSCNGNFNLPIKQTKAKGIICPMVKDEIGFLSEW